MKQRTSHLIGTAIAAVVPLFAFALNTRGNGVQVGAGVFSFLNFVLFITALIAIRQYIWPGYNNRIPFQVFNLIFAILFYGISIPFLIANREYYEGYGNMVPLSIIAKFFLGFNIGALAQWVILASCVFNVLYIRKYWADYFEAGVADDHHHHEEEESHEDADDSDSDPDV